MEFKELTYVRAIAKYQHITAAAEALYVSQPSLSKFLKNLEDSLGLQLFRKVGNKYILTFAGERYLDTAEKILMLKNDLDLELADIVKRDVGLLKVAFPAMRCTYMLPAALPAFKKIYPHVKVSISEDRSNKLDDMLLNGEVEVAFYNEPPKGLNPLLEYELLEKEELLICTPAGHPLRRFAQPNPGSTYPKLDLSLLKNELVLMMIPAQRTRQIVDDCLQKANLQLENVIYTSNINAIMELVARGYGVSFVNEPHLKHSDIAKRIDCYSFGEPRTTSSFVASHRKGSYLSIYARAFIEIIRQIEKGTLV